MRVEVGSGTARSVATNPGGGSNPPSSGPGGSEPPRTPPGRVDFGGGNTAPATQSDIAARVDGSTAGTVERGGQPVFASSAAPQSAKAKGKKAAAAGRKSAKGSEAAALSQRSAVGDLWTGVASGGADLASAASAGETDSALNGGVIAAVAMLGLGLVGLTGAVLVAGRRRRAGAAAGAPKNQ